MTPRPLSNHPTLVERRIKLKNKKARHLELIEEVKQEMQGKISNKQTPTTPDRNTKAKPAEFAMTIRLDTDTKPILKDTKD